jgi:hypothetical protein
MPQIFVLSGPDVGKSFELSNNDSIGRSPDCVITLRDASVSRRHAHVERNGPQWFIVDDGSRNGIVVDGAKQKRAELTDMQEFSIGEILLRFRSNVPSTRPAPPKVEAPLPEPAQVDAPPPAPVAKASAPVPAAAEDDELVLGGGDEEIELDFKDEPAPRPRAAPAPARTSPPSSDTFHVAETIAARPPSSVPPPAAPRPSVVDTGFGRRPGGAGDTISRRAPGAGDRVLQYHKVANARGFAGTQLEQLPAWMRWGAYVLVFAIAAAIAYFAFFGTASLKSKLGGGDDGAAEETGQ